VPALRASIELLQPYDAFKPFSFTTSSSSAETVLTVSNFMNEANKITLIVDKADLYINFNGTATTDGTSMLVPAGTGYTEEGIQITGPISVIRSDQSMNGRIVGAIWGRDISVTREIPDV
jgi:hypothetical protein